MFGRKNLFHFLIFFFGGGDGLKLEIRIAKKNLKMLFEKKIILEIQFFFSNKNFQFLTNLNISMH